MTTATPYLLAVLCAQWCSNCERFRPEYLGPALETAAQHRLWIDIENDADALPDDLEVASLPMLLVAASPSQASYFGPVRPEVQVVQRLARWHGTDSTADALLARIVRGWLQPT
jgi:thioredoxin 1